MYIVITNSLYPFFCERTTKTWFLKINVWKVSLSSFSPCPQIPSSLALNCILVFTLKLFIVSVVVCCWKYSRGQFYSYWTEGPNERYRCYGVSSGVLVLFICLFFRIPSAHISVIYILSWKKYKWWLTTYVPFLFLSHYVEDFFFCSVQYFFAFPNSSLILFCGITSFSFCTRGNANEVLCLRW